MHGIVRWAINNTPAMNILMLAAIIVGGYSLSSMKRETFPDFDLDMILVQVPYPGAAPQEVEEGICQKIEEAVRSLEGIKKVTSVAAEGVGSIVIELQTSVTNPDRVLDEVRSEIDRIPSFPEESEDPEVRRVTTRRPAIRVGVIGPEFDTEEAQLQLRSVAEKVRDELLQLEGVSQVDFINNREYQIDVEMDESVLRSHGLTLGTVAEIIRRENRELPAGTIRGESQEVLLRGNNRRTTGDDIAELPLITKIDGAVLTIEDLGTVRDELADTTSRAYIQGKPAMAMTISRSSDEDLLKMVDVVKTYVSEKKLPSGYELLTWSDQSVEVRGRLNLLVENAIYGLIIVFVLLILFLDLELAIWVSMGIPFSLFAAGIYLFAAGETMNMISMFGFLMALGIVVDDAIVVGENIYAHRQMGKPLMDSAVDGTTEVMSSVASSTATTVMAFLPLLFVSGVMGKFMAVMPMAIIAILLASLFECVTILPCHLAHKNDGFMKFLGVILFIFAWMLPIIHFASNTTTRILEWFIRNVYQPSLHWALTNRIIVCGLGVTAILLTAAIVRSGLAPIDFFPKLDGNTVQAKLTFPDGTPERVTQAWTKQIEEAFWAVNEKLSPEGESLGLVSFRTVGSQVSGGGPPGANASEASGSHVGSVEIELQDTELREISSMEIVAAWREELGPVPGAESLTISSQDLGPGATPIEFRLLAGSEHMDELEEAVEKTKAHMETYSGLIDIADDSIPGKWEYRFRIKPDAQALGVRTADLAETVRAAFYGQEVMRVQRGRHEVKIMVRYPQKDRHRLASFNDIRIRLDDGIERPITELAEVDIVRGYSEINRLKQKRSIKITADIDPERGNEVEIVAGIKADFIPKLLKEYPGLSVSWEGQNEQRTESMGSLGNGFIVALVAMFMLLAFEFKSYFQPLLILAIIPFGAIGAVVGHAIMGMPLTFFSMFGLVALTGIVVNDSIVLVDFINQRVKAGLPINEALVEAGSRRFRPVLLTTITTVGGLLPLLMETSLQAQLLIPMATSIAFGEIFATVLVLFLVPVGYSIKVSILEFFAPGSMLGHSHGEGLPHVSHTFTTASESKTSPAH
ncbi:efflux RND transporter permease subunit [Bremerella sp. T1]|uniref:efflux RND transporter permease subunit n=1 Tax=Bremerella sp. TYQ1 TaxID=3119568 RepID=UPI001CCDFB1C|nr:efflux RND transporter permease subunit [Bremerella volcania]UBM35128.1 efflux RND transporter permease subunit [Bremerella volcania]